MCQIKNVTQKPIASLIDSDRVKGGPTLIDGKLERFSDLFLSYFSTAEKNGVPWRRHFKDLETSDVYKELELIEDKSIVYPDYYLQPFHAYDKGNLCWEVRVLLR